MGLWGAVADACPGCGQHDAHKMLNLFIRHDAGQILSSSGFEEAHRQVKGVPQEHMFVCVKMQRFGGMQGK